MRVVLWQPLHCLFHLEEHLWVCCSCLLLFNPPVEVFFCGLIHAGNLAGAPRQTAIDLW